MTLFTEHFLCPECGQSNRIDWHPSDVSPRDVDCIRCRRDVSAAIPAEGQEPSSNCTCTPQNLDAHVEGARFSVTKFNGPASGLGVPDLATLKAYRIKDLRDTVDAFIASHYDTSSQQALMALMMEASILANLPRLSYTSQAITWVKSIITMFYPLRDQVLAATTAQDVLAVAFDPALTPSDPGVTIEHAMSL